ncbi:replicative DNA helicase [Salibacterium salarium]|uniref:DNA 5'-3' helicase n=1 Tax=Salibacterium salarium TaxID=284579 RepID=A0A428N2G7_9BACI|nr:DnaB-like helicase C-terminal domain-containing protein [Salibacterium salarium]RSL32650.1 replicative DNA helicase [Salibacterium salarium]
MNSAGTLTTTGTLNHQDVQAEQSVLGAVLLEPDVLDDIVFLEPRDFATVKNRKIFEVMKYLSAQGKPVDVLTIGQEYNKFGRFDDLGGVTYLTELADSCPTSANVEHYAQIVRSKAIRRRGIEAASDITSLSEEGFDSDEEYFAAVEERIAEIRPQDTGKMRSFSESKEQYFQHLQTKNEFIPTGFSQFDTWAHGLWRGWLFISAGRPSVGKTAKLLQRVYNVATQDAGVVLLYSQEMDENQIKDRMIAAVQKINYNRIKNKDLSDDELKKVEKAYSKIENLPIFIQDSSGVTIEEVRATARSFKRKYGKIAMIAVDYLQIMSIPQKSQETRNQAIGNVTSASKSIARDMQCCFMMLSQMTRESENHKKPQLSHLKESGSIEQDADVVEFLWYDAEDEIDSAGKVVQQFIAKGRDIGVNDFRLEFKGWFQRFEEIWGG